MTRINVAIDKSLDSAIKIAAINEGLKKYEWVQKAIIERLAKSDKVKAKRGNR